jgi:hypothetical protein
VFSAVPVRLTTKSAYARLTAKISALGVFTASGALFYIPGFPPLKKQGKKH